MKPARRWLGVGVTVALMLALTAPSLSAQVRMRNSETQLLREAGNAESDGDLDRAEEVLRQLLEQNPRSSGAFFALERVLKAKGETVELLPVIDRFLEDNPEASGVRHVKLGVYLELDSLDALRAEAEAWMASDRTNDVPYRDVAGVYERAYGTQDALDVLRRGRAETGDPTALALEIGDRLATMGDRDGAVDEWALAIGEDAAQVVTVTRRVQGLTSGVPEAGRRIVAALAVADGLPRRRAGARIALDLGLAAEAMGSVRGVAADLSGRERTAFLTDAARRARDQGLVEVASWAYGELGQAAGSPAERRQFDQRIVDVSLSAGDTVAALAAQRRVAESFSRGSVDRRRATARVIRLEGAGASPDRLHELLVDFREDFPNAPELDDLAATVASALLARGDAEGAAALLEGVEGPRSSLEKAYLLFEAGEIEEGRGALLLALTGLPPSDATSIIQFAGLLGRLSPAGAALLASAGVEAHRGDGEQAAVRLVRGVDSLEESDRVPLLAEAARIADRAGGHVTAARFRERISREFPDAPEVGEATLELARFMATLGDGRDEAIRLLEELITSRPNAAVVPDARLELERLRGRR